MSEHNAIVCVTVLVNMIQALLSAIVSADCGNDCGGDCAVGACDGVSEVIVVESDFVVVESITLPNTMEANNQCM